MVSSYGSCTALKSDLQASTAELVFGTSLRLPGEFFLSAEADPMPDPASFLDRLRSFCRSLTATSPRTPTARPVHVPAQLTHCSHVYVRHDGVRSSLSPPYDGPFPVIKRSAKYFQLTMNGRTRVVSIDHVKPAHLEPSTP